MPTTPGCQSSPATTSAAACSWGAHSASAWCRMRCSVSRRSWFRPSSSRAISAARSGSSVSISSSAASARCRRPAALMRGPSRKPADWASTSPGSRSATRISARRPGLRVARHGGHALARDPAVLAPQRHHVAHRGQARPGPGPARRAAGSCPAAAYSAAESLSTTPAAHSSPAGPSMPSGPSAGCTTGQSGSSAPGRWWSVTSTSRPSSRARATSATDVTPQSTVMSSAGALAGDALDRLDTQAVALGAAGQLPGGLGAQARAACGSSWPWSTRRPRRSRRTPGSASRPPRGAAPARRRPPRRAARTGRCGRRPPGRPARRRRSP